MENKLVVVNPEEFGLEKTEASKIEEVFVPMLSKMTEMEDEYNKVIKLEMNPETCKKARELRLRYQKVRTGTAEIHKKAKSYYLAGGRFVDAWKNAQTFSATQKEDVLADIERHYEKIEEEKQELLHQKRILELSPFVEDVSVYQLKDMSKQGFDELLKTSKFAFEATKEAEKKADDDRIAKEKADKADQEKIRKENLKLKADAEKKEKEIAVEKEKSDKIIKESKEKADAEKEENEALKEKIRLKDEDDLKIAREAKEKKEEEEKENDRVEKLAVYHEFLKKNGVTGENKTLFHITKNDTEIKIYKLIDTLEIK